VTIHNNIPRLDSEGNILRVSDGSIAVFKDIFGRNRYYLYGSVYRPCPLSQQATCYMPCGWFGTTFGVYSSYDMVTWVEESLNIMPEMTNNASAYNTWTNSYFEPAVIYNRKTNKFVLWYQLALNAICHFPPSTEPGPPCWNPKQTLPRGVAVSDSPTGPFVIKHFVAPGFYHNGSSFFLWQDNLDAYMVYNEFHGSGAGGNNLRVVKLADDYTSIIKSQSSANFGMKEYGVEGGGIFKRNGLWHVLSGTGCCFCSSGGSVLYWTSKNPLGPYVYGGSVNRWINSTSSYVVPAQQFGVFNIPTIGEPTYLFVGMLYGSAIDHLKDHDNQYWWPLQFSNNGSLLEMHYETKFQLNI